MWPETTPSRLVAAVAGLVVPALLAPALLLPAAAQAQPSPVGGCSPGLGIGLTEIPSSTAKDPRAQLYIVDSVRPGASFTRRFQVCNGTPASVTVALYPGPALIQGGAFTVVEGRQASELASWITVTPAQLTVPTGERRTAELTVAVPAGAEPGERYGVVLAELPAQTSASGVSIAGRVGIRVYLDVRASGQAATDFAVRSLQAGRRPDGTPVVSAVVRNIGGRAVDLRGELLLKDGPGGATAGPFPADLGTTLAPGQEAPVTVVLRRDTPAGPWQARLTARSGLVERAAEAPITFPADAGTSATPVVATPVPVGRDNLWVVIAGALIGLLALALLLLALLRRHGRRRADIAPQPQVGPV